MNPLSGVAGHVWLLSAVIAIAAFAARGTTTGARARVAPVVPQPAATGDRLVRELGCAACHAGVPASLDLVRERSPYLSLAGRPREAAYVFAFLQDPVRLRQIGVSRMPSFHLDERESLALTLFLESRSPAVGSPADSSGVFIALASFDEPTRREQDRTFARARREHSDVTAAMGETIYAALGCASCHDQAAAPIVTAGPNLLRVSRFRNGWLREYLTRPTAIRPFGFRPGSGSRMPDFRLTGEEADSITGFLTRNSVEAPAHVYSPQALSAFSSDKAERLLRDRLSCLGCHQLDGEGGRIGPDLSGVGSRLEPAAIHAMIADPEASVPTSIMPRQLMPADRIDLLANYLVARSDPQPTAYLSLIDHPLRSFASEALEGQALYERYCAACHGARGEADGFNVPFLPVSPTAHADSAYMSRRPDDTLFDGIHAGAYVLNRHHRMPAFGQLFTSQEIRNLVGYMRVLCRCEGPTWSQDGRRN